MKIINSKRLKFTTYRVLNLSYWRYFKNDILLLIYRYKMYFESVAKSKFKSHLLNLT